VDLFVVAQARAGGRRPGRGPSALWSPLLGGLLAGALFLSHENGALLCKCLAAGLVPPQKTVATLGVQAPLAAPLAAPLDFTEACHFLSLPLNARRLRTSILGEAYMDTRQLKKTQRRALAAGIEIWESAHVYGGHAARRDAKRVTKRARRRAGRLIVREFGRYARGEA
jgi:hypothetical protein